MKQKNFKIGDIIEYTFLGKGEKFIILKIRKILFEKTAKLFSLKRKKIDKVNHYLEFFKKIN